jgi:hypothetical protein
MHLTRRIIALPLMAVLIVAASAVPAWSQTVPPAVTADANWILHNVLPSGAIELSPSPAPYLIEPYFANYAAMGLARAATLTGNAAYATAAWNWLAWYSAHEGTNGFVTNYSVTATGAETSTGTYDSTDAYAGSFLSAVGMAYPTNPGRAATIVAGIHGAINAILATRDSDGLTWATPTWPVKYLEDNAESYAGLQAAARVETALGDTSWASVASSAASAMLSALRKFWNSAAQDYNWAKFSGGGEQMTDWTVLYPDALEQIAAVAFHVAGAHASTVMSTFATYQPDVANPAKDNYQPQVAIALEANGATSSGDTLAQAIDSYAAVNHRVWPFQVGVAGQLIFAETNTSLLRP